MLGGLRRDFANFFAIYNIDNALKKRSIYLILLMEAEPGIEPRFTALQSVDV